ncbi:hypothetical protein ACFRQM_05985 [Streptomyces sp. NPDC056831]|uniref:hypothetical protein n=1 Tax=Streptomyces sp. NPDC056831 TaxID=3345954 RepID=UPI00369283FE
MTTRARNPVVAGARWLARCATSEESVRNAWQSGDFAVIPSGALWLVAEAPLTRTVDAMQLLPADSLGPVLAHPLGSVAWWLVPLDSAVELWHVKQLTIYPSGWPLCCPPINRPAAGRVWLEKPDGSGRLSDPAALGAAFDPGGYLQLPVEAFC